MEESILINKEELRKFALKNGLPLFTQERDYVQTMFLFRLSLLSDDFIFKGGTCLKFVYGSNRFSEDIDLDFIGDEKTLMNMLKKAVKELEYIDMRAELNNVRKFFSGFRSRLKYQGPLYTGDKKSMGSIRIDINLKGDLMLKPSIMPMKSEYPEVSQFFIQAMKSEEILVEKVRALIIRGKARDLFDLWFLVERNTEIDLELINKKLSMYKRKFEKKKLDESIKKIRKEWNKDLKNLLPKVPDFEMVKDIVLKRFDKL